MKFQINKLCLFFKLLYNFFEFLHVKKGIPLTFVIHPKCDDQFRDVFISTINSLDGKVEIFDGDQASFNNYCTGLYIFISGNKISKDFEDIENSFFQQKLINNIMTGLFSRVDIGEENIDKDIIRIKSKINN